jgi:lipopolysaccharide transport system permease protein
MLWYRFTPWTEAILVVPLLLLKPILTNLGIAVWCSAMAVQYRDVVHGLQFAIQTLMYFLPVVSTTWCPRGSA